MGRPRKSDNPADYKTDKRQVRLIKQPRYSDKTSGRRSNERWGELNEIAVGFGFKNTSNMLTAMKHGEAVVLMGKSVNEAAVNALNRHIDAGGSIAFDDTGHLVILR